MRVATKGSGNVFRDLGFPNAEVLQAKADLVHQISAIIANRGLTQIDAANILGIGQPKVSELLHGRIDGFSMDRLIRFLGKLDHHVKITVRPKTKREPSVVVE